MDQNNQFANYRSLRKHAASAEPVDAKKLLMTEDLDALYETALSMMSYLQTDPLCEEIVYRGCTLVGTEHGFIYLVNAEEEVLELKFGKGLYNYYSGIKRRKEEPSVSSEVWRTGRPIVVDNLAQWNGKAIDRHYGWETIKSVLGIPLYSGFEVNAVIGLGFSFAKLSLTIHDMEVISRFATLASLALHNVQQFCRLQEKLQLGSFIQPGMTPPHQGLFGQVIVATNAENHTQPDLPLSSLADHTIIARSMWQRAQLHLPDAYLSCHSQAAGQSVRRPKAAESLTEREKAVLKWMAEGLSNQEIAAQINVELSTIKTHANHLFAKLGVKRRVQALIRARELGLL